MVLVVSESVLVGNIVQYIFEAEPDRGQTGVAYLFAMGLSLCALTLPFLHAHGFLRGYMLGMDTRVITTAAIYQKVSWGQCHTYFTNLQCTVWET